MKLPKLFYADRSSAGAGATAALQQQATRVLRRVAHDLRLRSHEIVLQPARRNIPGRVSLRTETLFVDVLDRPCQKRVALSFRTRRGRSDVTGGGENYVPIEQIESVHGYASFLEGLRLAGGIDTSSGDRR
ncbi:hypothetical protein WQE_16044 [Paraburkholderia hospita]|uniref:Uncharacterized protein n=1 Tax=Paraburkholderia hospita TaxID=169430 RepID=A0ABP2PS83_9BURK|nr:hypothetical protein [Paraburkholderia hospita]EIN00051.1 hypothetical protein WQE_16044 [Paraburkholderia hospita]OUL87851.1 hypothetical protein CA602_12925 [Paraburkholderia hospita]